MVPLARIGLATPSLPMTCSTTELQRRQLNVNIHSLKIKIKYNFLNLLIFYPAIVFMPLVIYPRTLKYDILNLC